jgi:hypothetical protein
VFEAISTPVPPAVRSAPARPQADAETQPRRVRKTTPPLLVVRGMNSQSLSARQYRKIALGLADEFGGQDKLSAPTMALIRQAASMTVTLEDMTTKAVAGEAVDMEQLTRLSNVLGRTLHRLGLRKPQREPSFLAALAEAAR